MASNAIYFHNPQMYISGTILVHSCKLTYTTEYLEGPRARRPAAACRASTQEVAPQVAARVVRGAA